jgi:hypothetical protein
MRILLVFLPVVICLAIFTAAAHALAAAAPPQDIPAAGDSTGIHGTVTYAGVPSGTVPLQLKLLSGGVEYIISTTDTLADGSYSFPTPPSLNPGESYFILYDNFIDPLYIAYWYTRVITQFTSGQAVDMGTFDIENLPQTDPPDMSEQTFPVAFKWIPRATQTDKYQVHIVNFSGSDYYSPLLTYTDTFSLDQLPSELTYDTPYFWEMLVYSPDGGSGVNTDWFQLTLINSQKIYLPNITK